MEIILTEDVYELGKRGDIVKVAAGYGRNFLLPNKLAVMATVGNRKVVGQQRLTIAKKQATHLEEAELVARELEKLHLLVSHKAGESGVLFGSVTAKDVVRLLKGTGIQIDRRKVMIESPIKSIGNYEIKIRPHSDVHAVLLLSVLIEGDAPVFRSKHKDAESDRIVADLNAKVREIGLSSEGRIVTESVAPPVEENEEAADSEEVSAASDAPAEAEIPSEDVGETADSGSESATEQDEPRTAADPTLS